MADLIARKEVASLPGTLAPDTLYFVRTGAGFDLYLTDNTGTTAHKLNGPPIATLAEFASAAADKVLATDSVYGDLVPLTDAATISVDLNNGYDFGGSGNAPLTLGGNRTLGSPSNPRTGKKGVLWFTASAARTLTLHASWKLSGGVEVGPYELAAGDLLGVAYVCVGSTVVVTGIIKVEA